MSGMSLSRREALGSLAYGLAFSAAHAQTTHAPSAAQASTEKAPPSVVAGIPVNYDESRVGTYTLPDPLKLADGKPVRDAKTWYHERRPQIVRLYEENQFGRSPGRPAGMHCDVFDKGTPALNGKAIRRQITIYFSKDISGPKVDVLLYLPAQVSKPVPVLLNISFSANSSMVDDPGVKHGEIWNKAHKKVPAPATAAFGKVDIPQVLAQGMGFATAYYGDIEPDFDGGLPYGVRALYLKPGQSKPAPNEWGAIAAWSWGLSRIMDYLETDRDVDSKHVALIGVSRLGKTVLWAGARDTRFALVIASCSGEGGAALSRRNYGETIKHLVAPTRFAYQFCGNYGKYADHVDELPVDGNMLVSLMAPRPLLLQTGNKDYWSDPKGEFLAAVAAGPVFELLGAQGLGTTQMPPARTPILHTLGYYMHDGGHGTLPSDWEIFFRFLRMHGQSKV